MGAGTRNCLVVNLTLALVCDILYLLVKKVSSKTDQIRTSNLFKFAFSDIQLQRI